MNSPDKLDRRDVDGLSTQILISLGILNGAAMAAIDIEGFPTEAFAVGLMCAIISQVWWYINSVIEYTYGDQEFVNRKFQSYFELTTTLVIMGGAGVSATCLVAGVLKIIGLSYCLSIFSGFILCVLPLIIVTYFAIKYPPRL